MPRWARVPEGHQPVEQGRLSQAEANCAKTLGPAVTWRVWVQALRYGKIWEGVRESSRAGQGLFVIGFEQSRGSS